MSTKKDHTWNRALRPFLAGGLILALTACNMTMGTSPAEGIGYNTKVPGRHAGESLHEKNAFVGAWGAPLVPRQSAPRVRTAVNGSMPILVYEYLTRGTVTPGQDGWGYPSLASSLLGAGWSSPTAP